MLNDRYWPSARVRNFVKECYKTKKIQEKPKRVTRSNGITILATLLEMDKKTFENTNPLIVGKTLFGQERLKSLLGRRNYEDLNYDLHLNSLVDKYIAKPIIVIPVEQIYIPNNINDHIPDGIEHYTFDDIKAVLYSWLPSFLRLL